MMKQSNTRPLFIAFEGIDGSGKSTHSKLLTQTLESLGHPTYRTFEPTDSEIGTMIRGIITGKTKADPRTLAGLFVADRLNHILSTPNGMLSALNEGMYVITDRYYFSSYAYHSLDMDMNWVIAANSLSASILKPDVHFFIDVAPEICMQRIEAHREGIDLFETEEKLKAIRENYFTAFEKCKTQENIIIIDGNRSQDEVSFEIKNKLLEQFPGIEK